MPGVTADVGLRRSSGFDHLHPGNRTHGRKIIRRLPHIFIRDIFSNRSHTLVIPAGPALEIFHLAYDVLGGQACDIGGFGMALTRHQVTGATHRPWRCVGALHDPGCRRVLVRKPIRRVCRAADLGRVVFLGAARDMDRPGQRFSRGLILVRDVIGPGGQAIGNRSRVRRLRGNPQSGQQREQ